MIQHVEPKAIPLWVGGHAFLAVTSDFRDVTDARTGVVLRRVPVCGPDQLEAGLAAARTALGTWAGTSSARRNSLLAALGVEVAKYSTHLERLLVEELGIEPSEAAIELEAAVAVLGKANVSDRSGALAIISARQLALKGVLELLVPLLASGSTVVVCARLDAPSAFLALAELSGRSGFPDGVLNIIFGDQALTERSELEPSFVCLP